MLGHELRRNQSDDQQDAERDEDYVIQIANDRDEVGDQVDG
jgi:hypothetical protein